MRSSLDRAAVENLLGSHPKLPELMGAQDQREAGDDPHGNREEDGKAVAEREHVGVGKDAEREPYCPGHRGRLTPTDSAHEDGERQEQQRKPCRIQAGEDQRVDTVMEAVPPKAVPQMDHVETAWRSTGVWLWANCSRSSAPSVPAS